MQLVIDILRQSWLVLLDSAPFVLFGLAVAGLLKAFLPEDFVARHLGKKSFGSVLKASLLGAPLPLCSCGVVPAAAGLRRQGASRGATAAFLVSTPETGVDSIAVTYALLDPLMTVLRPLAALVTATCAGLLVNLLPDETAPDITLPPAAQACGCHGGCCADPAPCPTAKPTVGRRLVDGLRYGFGEILADIGPWLLAGIVIAGAIAALVPPGLIERFLGRGVASMLVMLVVGIPLYVCATASTPVVAALALKGLSPGAALVFLLAGPVTNAAALTVMAKILGRRATVLFVVAIAVSSLALGLAANALYAWAGLDVGSWVQSSGSETHGWFAVTCAVVLLALTARPLLALLRLQR